MDVWWTPIFHVMIGIIRRHFKLKHPLKLDGHQVPGNNTTSNTLPETNSSHPRMDDWNTSSPLGWSIFRGGELLVSGRVIIWLLMGLGYTLSFCSHPTHTTLSHGSSLGEGGVSCWRCLTGAWFKTLVFVTPKNLLQNLLLSFLVKDFFLAISLETPFFCWVSFFKLATGN